MRTTAIRTLGALLALVLLAGALPAQAACNCTMPPAPSSCCEGPSESCASSDLAIDDCQAVVEEDAAILCQIHESSSKSCADSDRGESVEELPAGCEAATRCQPDTSPQIPDICLFALDCAYLN